MNSSNDSPLVVETRPAEWFCQELENSVYRAPSHADTLTVAISSQVKQILQRLALEHGVSMMQVVTEAQLYTARFLRYDLEIPWNEVKQNVTQAGVGAVREGNHPSMDTYKYKPTRPELDTQVNTYLAKDLNEYRKQFRILTGGTAEAVRIGVYYALYCYNFEAYSEQIYWGKFNDDLAAYIQTLRKLIKKVTDDG